MQRLRTWFLFVLILLAGTIGTVRAQLLPTFGVAPGEQIEEAGESEGFDRALPRPLPPRAHILEVPDTVETGFAQVNTTQSIYFDQDETSIAIDPHNAQTILIGAIDDRNAQTLWAYVSHDGGRTWQNQALPPMTLMELATDPSVVFDTTGVAYFLSGRLDTYGNAFPQNDVACYRSIDGGDTWELLGSVFEDSTVIGGADTLADKYYLAIDRAPGSPYSGRLYATWVDQGTGDTLTRIVCSSSSDGGRSWTPRRYVTPDRSFYQAPVPVAAVGGVLYISYDDILHHTIDVARSVDGGATFSTQVLSSYEDLGAIQPPGDNRGYPIIKKNLAVNSFPAIAADARDGGSGHVYVVWTSQGAEGRDHVYLMIGDASTNQWNAARAVDGDTGTFAADKFYPWVAVDPSTGDVGIDYYDSRDDPENRLTNLYLALSHDNGQTFYSERVSNASFDPTVGDDFRTVRGRDFKFFGDYIGLAARDRVWRPAWCDGRSGDDLEVYTSTIRPYAPRPVQALRVLDTLGGGKYVVRWSYANAMRFGMSPRDFQFEVQVDDGAPVLLDSSQREYLDPTSVVGSAHRYDVRVIAGADTSDVREVYVGTQSVAIADDAALRSLYVAADGTLRLHSVDAGVTQIRIFDALGRLVAHQNVWARSGWQRVDAPELAGARGALFYRLDWVGGTSRVETGRLE